jgi:hypothetical protein
MRALDLSEVCRPVALVDLLAARSAHRFRHFKGWNGKFDGLLEWRHLNDILERSLALPPRARLMKAGRTIDPAVYLRVFAGGAQRMDCDACLEQLRLGATLVIDAIDELVSTIGAVASQMERRFRAPIQVNLYAAWKSEPALDLHWDLHDVIILQVAGRKRWKVYEETARWPVDIERHAAARPGDERLVWEGELDNGDALFIPRGWWHEATPCDAMTTHLTCGINSPPGLRVVEWLAEELADDEFLRRDVPADATPEEQAAYLREFHAKVAAACSQPDLLERFLTTYSAKCRKREHARLGPSIGPHTSVPGESIVDLTVPFVTFNSERSKAINVGVGQRIVTLDHELATILSYIHTHSPTPVAAVYDGLAKQYSRVRLEECIVELHEAGILTVSAADAH